MSFRAQLHERCGARCTVVGTHFVPTCTLPPRHDGDHLDEALEPAVGAWRPCSSTVGGDPCLLPDGHEGDCRR